MASLFRLDGLWRHPDFLRLWGAQTVSLAGTLIGGVALPLVAILTLNAAPGEVALIRIGGLIPAVAIGLFAGVWVDRLRRRPLMIWADLGRAALLLSIPLAWWADVLRLEQLLLVTLFTGTLTALFDVAYHAYLPTVIHREQLIEGHSKLEASGAVVEVAAFGLGGWLVQVLTAPVAIIPDAVSFLFSALCLGGIRKPEPPPVPTSERATTWAAIREGIRLLYNDPVLRAIACSRAMFMFWIQVWVTMYMVFLTRDLELEPVVFGWLFAIGGVSSFGGALLAGRMANWLGIGPTLIVTLIVFSLSLFLVPLASGPLVVLIVMIGAQQLGDGAGTINQIHESTLMQTRVSDEALGRVAASLRVLEWTAMLLGTAAGGVLGETVGPRMTLLIGAIGALPSVLWLIFSPIRTLRSAQAARPASEEVT